MLSLCLALAVLITSSPDLINANAAAKPLTELGIAQYKGFAGGLYPDGKDERPATHERIGLSLTRQIQPLDADGRHDRFNPWTPAASRAQTDVSCCCRSA
jgi:hypothetical protein